MNVNGEIFVLENDFLKVRVGTVGASLLSAEDKKYGKFLLYIDDDQFCEGYVGKTIAPWVNRVFGGEYTVNDKKYFLPITDLTNNAAIHGLVAWKEFSVDTYTSSYICLSTKIFPSPAYPFKAHIFVEYFLENNVLKARLKLCNLSDSSLPVGLCFHPYIVHPFAENVDESCLFIQSGDLSNSEKFNSWDVNLFSGDKYFFSQECLSNFTVDTCYKVPKENGNFWKASFGLYKYLSDKNNSCAIDMDFDVKNETMDEKVAVFLISNCDYVQLYSGESVGRRGFAIEPCSSNIDSFGDSKGGEFLLENEEKVLEFAIGVESFKESL